MKLIVGLGNPGDEYSFTRHNIGFMVIDSFAKEHNVIINKNKFGGLYNFFDYNGEKIYLLKPQKFINLSGEVIKKFIDYFNIDINDMLIINDDLDLNFLDIRLKERGSSGGHNGLKNIELNIGTNEYKRLKIGISNNKSIDTKDYVLGKFNSDDLKQIKELCVVCDNIIDDFLNVSFERLMNKYN